MVGPDELNEDARKHEGDRLRFPVVTRLASDHGSFFVDDGWRDRGKPPSHER
jgi:hypothetical protein